MTNNIDPLNVVRTGWLIATGDAEQVQVRRSPLVRPRNRMYEPVRRYIVEHGLVLSSRETFPDPDFMYGEVEVSTYATPAAYAEAVVSA